MRIALLSSIGTTLDAFFPPLADEWKRAGHQVYAAASTPCLALESRVIPSLSRRPAFRNLMAPSQIDRWLLSLGADVLLTSTATASFWARVRRGPVPAVYFCHGLHWESPTGLAARVWQAAERQASHNTAGVVVINSDDQQWFDHTVPDVPQLRLRHGVGLALSQYPFVPVPQMDSAFRLVWIGELSARKRPGLAIDIAVHLRRRGLPVTLRLLGEGPLRSQLATRIQQEAATDFIWLPGHSEDVPGELARSHALLHTAQWEGLPRVCLEALAVGRRTFAFDTKGVRDVPQAVLAPDGDVVSLSDHLMDHIRRGPVGVPVIDRELLSAQVAAHELESFMGALIEGKRTR
ncbi:MAG: glycosyltransferase [Propionibacteriaceae bacterium]|nr:glycosyltransferase [Propionibacteriaceae bacterium]